MDIKTCSRCNITKPLSDFYKYPKSKDGHEGYCKECRKKISRHVKHPEIPLPPKHIHTTKKCSTCKITKPLSDFSPKKRKDTKDGTSSVCKACTRENRKERYWSDPEKARAYVRSRPYDPVKAKIARNIRRARERSGENFTRHEWQELKRKYNYTCLCCGKKEPEIKLTHDHVIPVSKNGANTIDNIQPLCHECNNRKYIDVIDYRPTTINP